MTIILAALIIAMSTVLSAIVLARVLATQRRAERREDHARLDMVADKAAERDRTLIDTNRAIANRTAANADAVEVRLDVIHELVNSGLTAAKQSEYDALHGQLLLMREVVALHQAEGREPSPETVAAIESITVRLTSLGREVQQRRQHDQVADDLARRANTG